jgi:ribosomal protein S21
MQNNDEQRAPSHDDAYGQHGSSRDGADKYTDTSKNIDSDEKARVAANSFTHRTRLELKPRSTTSPSSSSNISHQKKKAVNPFGSAKPREENLARKGVDPRLVDERIQKKAGVVHFTRVQELKLETLQTELTAVEEELRIANEGEMPEEILRLQVDEKRKALKNLVERFKKENEEKEEFAERNRTTGYERPSERRRRRLHEHAYDNDGTGYHTRDQHGYDDSHEHPQQTSFGWRNSSSREKSGIH